MKDQLINPINTAIRFGIVVLAFLTPLFFLPVTSEFYQFNKQALVLVTTSVLLVLWGVKMGIEGKMRIVRTPIDLPVLLFALAFILATVFSVDRYISIAGFYPRFHGNLVLALSYVALYFIAVSNLDKQSRQWVIWAAVGSGVIAAILGILNFFGYNLIAADYAKPRTWTPLGNSSSLTLYLALLIPLALGGLITAKNRLLQSAFLVAAIVMLLPIFLFKLIGPMIALGLGLLVALVFSTRIKVNKDTKAALAVFALATAVILFITLVPGLQNTFLKPLLADQNQAVNIAADKTLPLGSAWKIATQAVGQRPFFGVGPSTFAYSFTGLKGQELNSDDYWNLRFDLSGNEYLTLLTNIGIVGITGFVLILLMFSKSLLTFNYQSQVVRENPLSIFLLSSLVVFLVGIFFQDTTISIWVFFVILAALSFSYLREWGVKNVQAVDVKLVAITSGMVQFTPVSDRHRDSSLGTIFTIAGVAAFLLIIYFGLPTYQAEVSYQQALLASTQDKAVETRDHLISAKNKNPYRDTYRRSLVALDRLLAVNLSQKENRTDEDNQNIAALVSEAIQEGTRITGYEGRGLNNFTIRRQAGTSPLNVANWEALSSVLSALQLEGENRAINAANSINVASHAVNLDPRNPVLHETLGNILLNNGLVDNAIQAYERAITVRPAYSSAHYNLANALKQKGGNESRVVLLLETTLQLLPPDSPDRDRVNKELEEARAKVKPTTTSPN